LPWLIDHQIYKNNIITFCLFIGIFEG